MKVVVIGRRKAGARRLSSSGAAALLAVVLMAGCAGDAEEESSVAGRGAATSSPSQPTRTGTAPQTSAPVEGDSAPPDDAGVTTPAPPGEPDVSAQDEAVQEVVITISDFAYDVPDTIAPGTQVTIRNEDRVGHTITSDEEGLFDVLVGGGQEETFTVPDQPGEYSFFCKPHPNMVDALVIG